MHTLLGTIFHTVLYTLPHTLLHNAHSTVALLEVHRALPVFSYQSTVYPKYETEHMLNTHRERIERYISFPI